jgi:hypothetical protein
LLRLVLRHFDCVYQLGVFVIEHIQAELGKIGGRQIDSFKP